MDIPLLLPNQVSMPDLPTYLYAAVKGSLHASDCSVFGLNCAEIQALTKRYQNTSSETLNGVIIKGTLLVSEKMSQSHCHSHNIVTPSVYQTLDELDFERGLWSPAQNGDMSRVKNLLERGVPVDSRDSAGYTALHYAARAGHAAICQQLIGAGALLDTKTRAGGATPLHRAAASGKLHIVQLLLEAGANSAVTDADGRTALHRAAEEGHSDVAELLLKNNTQLNNMKDIKGRLAVECVKDQTMLSVFL
ncbi:ankyrin repeat domain-containing protein 39-like isoform X1 [Schistocerca serialis cubense]|uniref:ankyrin repeat domain-containing protein 39-like isoform X1 n=1 Tax=Schistocerca serialis cubense TaxID=2023355 RepID=UPI00214EA6DC|nr:ankyrin repeat domain-containing protein 39-like isoform X1 [Schistocerca serialis cubense]XP_049950546.1 ankyrin repeat domain-containing protein 39-like isoform X1 [Schistocerca serialis cubense]